MIRRFFTLLLVFLMLANQGLCLPHTHHGSAVGEPEDHGSRPHIHVGGHAHHGHGRSHHHADHSHSQADSAFDEQEVAFQQTSYLPVDDHDSNAVYLAERVATARQGGRLIGNVPKTDVAGPVTLLVTNQNDRLQRWGPIKGQPPSLLDGSCPIYLRTLSLRN